MAMDELELLRKIARIVYAHKKSRLNTEYLEAMELASEWRKKFEVRDGKRKSRVRTETER